MYEDDDGGYVELIHLVSGRIGIRVSEVSLGVGVLVGVVGFVL